MVQMDIEIYKIWAIVGFLFLFIELAVPTLFFLNLAIGAFFAGIYAYFFIDDITAQIAAFAIISVFSVILVRPFLLKKRNPSDLTGIEGKYIGKNAQVISAIGAENTDGVGKVKIYGEVWEARSEHPEQVFHPFEMVEIVRNESLILYVKKSKEN